MESSHRWAQVTAEHIARFGELTKREIQVICALFLCRNGKTKRCDPSRRTIGELTDLERPHVHIALTGLERKGWVIEMPDGEFHIFAAADIPGLETGNPPVEKSVEKSAVVTNSVTPSVTNLVTPVTNSVTPSYQNGNAFNESEQTSKQKREQKRRAPRSKPKPKVRPTRIPDPFPLTDEMIDWFNINVPDLAGGPAIAHHNFVEYWTNLGDVKKAYAVNWRLRWQKGMFLLLTWQMRDDRKSAGIDPAPLKGCPSCGGDGTYISNDWRVPCHDCQPNRHVRFMRERRK